MAKKGAKFGAPLFRKKINLQSAEFTKSVAGYYQPLRIAFLKGQ
jgi:hypothetical protein